MPLSLFAVAYMNYGPYSSYAPTYDSSFANISKEDSDLIYSFYGEDNSQPESERCVYRISHIMKCIHWSVLDG